MLKNRYSEEKTIAAGQYLEERDYWLTQLSGELENSTFPVDYIEKDEKEYGFDKVDYIFSKEVSEKLMNLVNGSDAKLHIVLTAALVGLLNRYTGSSDIIVGIPIYKQEVEGEFINTLLAIRNQITDHMTFKELLLQVRQNIVDAIKNQNYPVEALIYDLNLTFDKNHFPLFDIVILLENIHNKEYIQHINVNTIFFFSRTDEGIKGWLEYNSLLYRKTTIEIITAHFMQLLREVLYNLDVPQSSLCMLSGKEKQMLLYDFANSKTEYQNDKTIHQLFEMQVEKTPDNIAVAFIDNQVKYKELNEKANQLAHVLREKGVTTGRIVGIMVDPSIEMIVGIIAILKSAGAYLPIDINYPGKRVQTMLKDSSACILVTKKHLMDKINFEKEIIAMDDNVIYKEKKNSNPNRINASHNLAYVIYTSGSTAQPKGVLIEHRSIRNYVSWRIQEYCQTSSDVSLQLISVSFDGFAANLYPTILSGGKVVLSYENDWRDIDHIRYLIKCEGITNFSIVPSFYRIILEGAEKDDFKTVRFVVLAGEKASKDLITLSNQILPGITLINEYGPTENSVTTTANCDLTPMDVSVIGKPIANSRVFVLGKNQKLQPIGVPGELCISGDGLSRGYLNKPGLTGESFVTNPYFHDEKMYRSGDLAKWLPGGNIDFLGRIDCQVKIRGFRIEPEEIESQLKRHKEIKEALVDVKERKEGDKYLCVYFVSDNSDMAPGKEPGISGLREYLSRVLPDYMIPSYFMRMDSIPLTPNGKVDRNKLPAPEPGIPEGSHVAPRDKNEEKLAEIWSEVLDMEKEKISINTNFFESGGHSLKAAALASKIQREFDINIPLVDIFEAQTIEKLAEYLKTNDAEIFNLKDENLVLLRKQKDTKNHFFFIHDGSGEVDGYVEFCNNLSDKFNYWGIKADRFKVYAPGNLSIKNAAKKYVGKIKKIQPHGPFYIAGWSLGGTIAFEICSQLEQMGEETRFLALIDSAAPCKDLLKEASEFTVESESKWFSEYFPGSKIKKRLRNAKKIDQLWSIILKYLKENNSTSEIVEKIFPENMTQAVPNIDQLSAADLVYYLNVGRSFKNAQMFYIPGKKIKTPIHYFMAADSEGTINKDDWANYSYKPLESFSIDGDHFSIFKLPQVVMFAKLFNKVVNEISK